MCPGSGTEFKDLIRGIDSLIFLLDLFKFILSLSFSLDRIFCVSKQTKCDVLNFMKTVRLKY